MISRQTDPFNFPKFWFYVALLVIFLVSLALRFWRLGQFNKLVFDEVYYAKYGNYYLIGKTFFNSHPPLSQYIIAIGIWLGSHFPASPEMVNDLTGSARSTFSYRWLNALTGSFIPLIVGAIAYQLTYRDRYTLIVTLLAACDGLFLVESRYALNNIYLVLFGILGQLFFLLAVNANRILYLTFSGVFFGAAVAIKWNGLGFLLGVYLLLAFVFIGNLFKHQSRQSRSESLFDKIQSIQPLHLAFNLTIVPLFIYSILWLPHLIMNPQDGFEELHQKIWSFHHRIGNTPEVHPYCSKWYSWLIMWRPIAYFYQATSTNTGKIIYDVHAMGNPFLWWFSTGAILFIIIFIILSVLGKLNCDRQTRWLLIYILINYASNLLPWLSVTRCTFIYHYMASYVFAWLALAWVIERGLQSQDINYRRLGLLAIILVIIAFIYWLPIYLGIPLSQQGFSLRMWFPNWV